MCSLLIKIKEGHNSPMMITFIAGKGAYVIQYHIMSYLVSQDNAICRAYACLKVCQIYLMNTQNLASSEYC